MIQFFLEGGDMMWLFLILALLILFLSVRKAIQLYGKQDLPRSTLETGINAVIFWGAISAILGFFAHYLGVYYAMAAISRANDISPAKMTDATRVNAIKEVLTIFSLSLSVVYITMVQYTLHVSRKAMGIFESRI